MPFFYPLSSVTARESFLHWFRSRNKVQPTLVHIMPLQPGSQRLFPVNNSNISLTILSLRYSQRLYKNCFAYSWKNLDMKWQLSIDIFSGIINLYIINFLLYYWYCFIGISSYLCALILSCTLCVTWIVYLSSLRVNYMKWVNCSTLFTKLTNDKPYGGTCTSCAIPW